MAPLEEIMKPPAVGPGGMSNSEVEEWAQNVDEVTDQIRGIIDGTITDFEGFDKKLELKERAKQIRQEELQAKRQKFFLNGIEGKGEGTKYKWWCKRCFVEYLIDLPENRCTRCQQTDKMMTQADRRAELLDKVGDFKEAKAKHQWRKDKWNRWKKSQALLKRSRNINYKAWEYWEPNTDTEDEGEPICPRDNPEFLAMEADMKDRRKKQSEKAKTAEKCRQRGNQCMKEGDYVGAIENYEEGLEYNRSSKALWTNRALAELKIFRWHDAITSCNKVIEYSEIFEEGFTRSADACFKAFTRRAIALRALHKWDEALEDLEDALKLFPRDKDARDLLEKTKLACQEAKEARRLQEGKEAGRLDASTSETTEAPSGPVRVEIEESEDEEEDEAASLLGSSAQAGSVTGLTKPAFAELLKSLKGSEAQRVLFCTRKGGDSVTEQKPRDDKWVARKIELKVEEVSEPSRLDILLKDVERCHILWKKRKPDASGKILLQDDEPEAKEADAYVRHATPRVLATLQVIAAGSDHHCSLTTPAVRNVWPLLAEEEWRYDVMLLLTEWSQRALSAKAMAEFAGRYPDPNLRLLIQLANEERRENVLPPGFEDRAKKAADRLESGHAGVEEAMEEVLQGLTQQSPMEMAISTLGNVCLGGVGNAVFKEEAAAVASDMVDALAKHIRPMDWRVCGKAAGALCNVLRLGETLAAQVQEKCTKLLVEAIREEGRADGPAATMRSLLQQAGAEASSGRSGLPQVQPAADRLLGALVNLCIIRPAVVAEVRDLGTLSIIVPLIDDSLAAGSSGDEEGSAEAVAMRAMLLASRLVCRFPASVSQELEVELLKKLHSMLVKCKFSELKAGVRELASGSRDRLPALEWLDPAVRMLVAILTKTPGALDRLVEKVPRIVEVFDELDDLPAEPKPAVSFAELVARLSDLVRAIRPQEHVGPQRDGSTESRMRGNLALLFGALSEAQAKQDLPPALRQLDLTPLVDVFIDSLRKERGPVQNNIGVCVTKLAQNPRYAQQVRDLKGIESLHQIQIPKAQSQKAQADKMHRLDTSAEDRKAEILRRLKQRELAGLD
eukprot:TRINITY_DN2130_c0_g1_i1.p1 TRINITY_DN2130_c0_g1~~TRINITY_DN2130_c0_g1_i1.p1  ORF type:complete len:1073 (+),score=266.61 TRINITY_DN2130_c0_g1_i1:49-3267(+)